MEKDDYTLHFDEATGQYVRIPYDSRQSSDVGTSGWWSKTAEAAGVPRPKDKDNTAAVVAVIGFAVVVALLAGRR